MKFEKTTEDDILEVNLESTEGKLNFVGTNKNGFQVNFSGNGDYSTPMEVLLMSVAGCTAMDVEIILGKMRQNLQKLNIRISGNRAINVTPRPFTGLSLIFELYGDIQESKGEKAVQMAVEKYCSVLTSLDKNISIIYKVEYKGLIPEV